MPKKRKQLENLGFSLPQFDVTDSTYRYTNLAKEKAYIDLENSQITIVLKTSELKLPRVEQILDAIMGTLEENYDF